MQVKLSFRPNTPILGCPRCETAMLPLGTWPSGGPVKARCPLCGYQENLNLVEVGDAPLFNPKVQREDYEATPIYKVAAITYEDDLALVEVPDLLDDSVYYALQEGVAPIMEFGWVGGPGLMDQNGYRLFLIVRVSGLPEDEFDLFRVEFPAAVLPALANLTLDHTMVLHSQKKGVFCYEVGEYYIQAVETAGAKPGDQVAIDLWVALDDEFGDEDE